VDGGAEPRGPQASPVRMCNAQGAQTLGGNFSGNVALTGKVHHEVAVAARPAVCSICPCPQMLLLNSM